MSENFGCFAKMLYEEQVYEAFLSILANARKNVKPEGKVRGCQGLAK